MSEIFSVSFLVALNDFYTAKGSFAYGEGGYIGFLGLIFSFLLGAKEYLKMADL